MKISNESYYANIKESFETTIKIQSATNSPYFEKSKTNEESGSGREKTGDKTDEKVARRRPASKSRPLSFFWVGRGRGNGGVGGQPSIVTKIHHNDHI